MGRRKLNAIEALEFGAFRDLQDEIDKERRAYERRKRNEARGKRLLRRIYVVDHFDLWKATAHMRPNAFGNYDRFERVKELHNKKARLQWILYAMYYKFVFNTPYNGMDRDKKLPTKFSKFAKQYDRLYEDHLENVRQARWDEKRARVRARKQKRGSKSDARKNEQLSQLSKLRDYVDRSRGEVPNLDPELKFISWN